MRSTSFARVFVFVSAAGLFLGLVAAAPGASAALVLEYKFDEGSGGTAVDSSPSGNNGNVSGGGGASYTTTAAQGPFAIHLGATGNGLSWVQPAANPLAGVTSFTIAAWVDRSSACARR